MQMTRKQFCNLAALAAAGAAQRPLPALAAGRTSARDGQSARDPPSFQAGNEGTTDVREKAAHRRRHDQAPQSPDQVDGEGERRHGGGGLHDDGGRPRAADPDHDGASEDESEAPRV